MNHVLAGIYGTNGLDKTAAEGGPEISTLADLAMAIVGHGVGADGDFTKVASDAHGVLEDLEGYDLAGRAAAHAEFSEIEKLAGEGNDAALMAFFEA